jgi:predicted transposase/invertase (TIGR01784 family)
MKHRIDPKIDCVFKALLGSLENRNLLMHFLNAILAMDLAAPIIDVEILNPYNDKEFLDDKLSVVDVKAKDSTGRLYQVEIQLVSYRNLPTRMVYTWCDIVSQQLQSGQDYSLLNPVYSIWLLAENLLPGDDYAHEFKLRDRRRQTLTELGGIHVLELKKFSEEWIETEEQRWLKLFKDGDKLDESALPEWMNTKEMRQVMSTLKMFSEKERDYFAYQARQDFLREQRTIQKEMEQMAKEKERMEQEQQRMAQDQQRMAQEQQRMEQDQRRMEQALERASIENQAALAREQSAQAEIERLKSLLAQAGRGE